MMKSFSIRKGLDLPIVGVPDQRVEDGPFIKHVAVLGPDYPGMRPTMAVSEGDPVRLGQALFTDKKNPRVLYTSPGSGHVKAIHRGEKRALLAVEIALGAEGEEAFTRYPESHLPNLGREIIVETLLTAGLWTALRRRPFARIPDPAEMPEAVFVTAIDTRPLAADPALVAHQRAADFFNGLRVLVALNGAAPVYLCTAPGVDLPVCEGVTQVTFSGPHPAGLAGTHIHFLHPVNAGRAVWHIDYQDVCAVGHLFTHGRLLAERIVALGGPCVKRPRLVRTRLGASLVELLRDEVEEGEGQRVISGSVLHGRDAQGPLAFLGRYHAQVAVLEEGTTHRPLGWLRPGSADFSIRPLFLGALDRLRLRRFSTSTQGGQRAVYPIGAYEQVMPLDLSPTYLLRALAAGDSEEAQALGCLELDEEDLALCSFVCPGKNDYGPMLRSILDRIEKEG